MGNKNSSGLLFVNIYQHFIFGKRLPVLPGFWC